MTPFGARLRARLAQTIRRLPPETVAAHALIDAALVKGGVG